MKVERLVIDSNVWIAALISPAGTARQFVDAVLDLVAHEGIPILTPAMMLQRLRESGA
jgi:predicted nucleic acid-binding protein